jgi:glycosyltransferase involved in cell wall biosynthesis
LLASTLLAAIIAAPLSSAALFVPTGRRARTAGVWPATRRFVLALAGTAILGLIVAVALLLLGVPVPAARAAVVTLAAASAVWLPATRRWNARGHLCWAMSVLLFTAYLIFILRWTFTSHLGTASTVGGVVLWALEVLAALLACAYLWELCDALGTEHWRRRVTVATPTPSPSGGPPFASLHVPAHNEPPEMVIQTLTALANIDYPNFEIVVIDDNTEDEAMWRPVERWCAQHNVKFAHLSDWPGYKSGALNYALREMTDPRAELIGVVDSDYQIDPGFLGRCAPLFADPGVGFIQAPQDYRDWSHAPYYRRLYYSYKYFFAVSQPSRNERDGAIFAGTMGLIRRRALEKAGGWDEWCITEDAELSLRLLRGGWSGLHVDQSWGRGVMPLTFEALKSQRYRWCFGGIQILRMHWRSLLPGGGKGKNRLNFGQRLAYLMGGIQWYGDLLGLAFYVFLLAGAANLAAGGGQLFRKLTFFLVAIVPVLVGLGLLRAVALLRRGTGATWREAIGAFFVWQSTSLVVARASAQGLFARRAAFLRTPKTSERATWRQALRANWAETALALSGALGIAFALTNTWTSSGPLLAGLLLVPTLGFAAAPFNSLAAQRAALPADLLERRRTEVLRDRRTIARSAAASGAAAVALAGVAAVSAILLAPSHAPVRPPHLIGPGHGTPASGHGTRHGGSGSSGHPAPAVRPSSPAAGSPPATGSPSPTAPPSPGSSSPSPSGSPSPAPTTSAPATSAPATPAPATSAAATPAPATSP